MARVHKAIVLAAGQGKRLSPLTDNLPKCLIDLSGRTVLSWQLAHLHAIGLTEVVVVTGFNSHAVEAEVARTPLPGMTVRCLYNPFYTVSDNLATCWLVREELAGGALILNGDTIWEPEIGRRLLAAPAADITVTVDRKARYDSDDMKVLTRGDELLAIGKTITEYDAESIGFLRFSPEGARRFITVIDQILRDPAEGLKRWYLSVINQIAQEQGGVAVQSIEGLEWAEMDFPHDLQPNRELTARWMSKESVAA